MVTDNHRSFKIDGGITRRVMRDKSGRLQDQLVSNNKVAYGRARPRRFQT